MACCQSMFARRFLLWYILLGSFIILPLSWEVFNGCKMLEVDGQSYGLFKRAAYDTEGFIGCVDYSSSFTLDDDILFKIGRTAGLTMVMFSTIASILCLFTQCFSKAGKSKLWIVMRLTYILAFLSQGSTVCIYFADVCSKADQCVVGANGFHSGFNAFFLFIMVVATLCSRPPRNPVFRLWYDLPDYDTDQADSYDEDDEEQGRVTDKDVDDSVSLFGGSVRSRRNKGSSGLSVAASMRSSRKNKKEMDAINEDNEPSDPDGNSLVETIKSRNTNKSRTTNGLSISESSFQRHVDEIIDHGVVLGPGGIREEEKREGNQVIIIDKYPGSLLNPTSTNSDGADLIKVRSEYCPAGRKMIKEECHPDGSRTVTTTITVVKNDSVIVGIDP